MKAVAGLFLALVSVACGEGRAPGAGHDDPELRLHGAVADLEALGRRALDALVAEDPAALDALRLTEREHNEIVWPELPASAPEVHFPLDFAWSNIQGRNRAAVNRLLPIYGGESLAFHAVECRGQTRSFETFEVLVDCWVIFTRAGGELWQAQLFEEALSRGGGYKIFRYYDQEPRRYVTGVS